MLVTFVVYFYRLLGDELSNPLKRDKFLEEHPAAKHVQEGFLEGFFSDAATVGYDVHNVQGAEDAMEAYFEDLNQRATTMADKRKQRPVPFIVNADGSFMRQHNQFDFSMNGEYVATLCCFYA